MGISFRNELPLSGGTVTGTLSTVDIIPTTDNVSDLGSASKRFERLFSGRIVTGAATPTVAATGYGASGAVQVETGSSDLAGLIRITPGGAGIAANGTVTITYSSGNGAYATNGTIVVATLQNNTGTWNARASAILASSPTTTAFVLNWDNNAVALTSGQLYFIHYHVIGR